MEVNANEKPRSSIGMKRSKKSAVTNVPGDVDDRVKSQINMGGIVYS